MPSRSSQSIGRFDLYAIGGVAAVAVSRFLFRSHLLYDLDSVNFALGMRHFDPAAHQPHPPGYFLYVYLARMVNWLVTDANTALVAISIAASCGAAWCIYLLTKDWFGTGPAQISIILFLVSPLAWFHGLVALTYIVEAFFSVLIGYWCWRAYTGRAAAALPASVCFGVAAGFRPSTAVMLAPLWLFSIWRAGGVRRWLSILAAGAVMLAWFLPMMEAAGGMNRYFGAFRQLWSAIPGQRTALSSGWLAVARALTIGWIFIVCFGSASVFLFRPTPAGDSQQANRRRFLWIWITPGLLFFTFVFLNYVNSGYLLVLSPPLFAVLAARVHDFMTRGTRRSLRWTALAAGIAVNCVFFAIAPVYSSYRSIREFERELTAISRDFHGALNSAETLIVGFDSHFLGYRHAGYYLPEFVTAQYPEVGYADGKRVFVMKDRDTQVLQHFAIEQFRQFVLFPLPRGDEYTARIDSLRAKLPEGAMGQRTIGDRLVLSGPASVIPLLFPTTSQ